MISIIIPIYKVEEYIEKCIESVINQTYTNIEIILIDDGSPDNCGAICDKYAENDNRIKVIHKVNGGLSDARNAGMKIASGDYFVFIDSDDWVDKDYCEFLYNKQKEYDADIVVTPLRSVTQDGADISRKFTHETLIMTPEIAMEKMFARDSISWCAQAKLYRKELFEGVIYPVGVLMEDKATTYKLYHKANKIIFADTPKYNYLVRSGSIMRSTFSEKRLKSFDIQLELNTFLESNYPNTVKITHAYTAKNAVNMLCRMKAADMKKGMSEMYGYVREYKKELYSCNLIDYRFKVIAFVICLIYFFRRERMFEHSYLFGKIAGVVDRKLGEK